MSFTFVDIDRDANSDQYSYTYIFTIKSIFIKQYYKIDFKSKLPHYVFTDMWYVLKLKLKQENKFIEDVIKSDEYYDLGIGQFYIEPFTKDDKIKYTKSKSIWNSFLDKALVKQQNYEKVYEQSHGGYPNLNLPLR